MRQSFASSAAVPLAVAALAAGLFPARAQVSMQTLLSNGPASNRFNIAVLSEGYTSSQLAEFRADAAGAVDALLSREPYQEYRSYFNAYAISVASAENGSDHPASGAYRDTFFNSSYDAWSDYVVTIPPNAQDPDYSHGQGRVDALLQTNLPNCALAILLVNDVTPGGSDGNHTTAIASVGDFQGEILAHETGHVVAGLGDEYISALAGFPDTEEPNTTRETRRDFIKWKAWIDSSTPVPTVPPNSYPGAVGLFEGAHYHTTNWYRPKLDCAMRSQYVPFCEVCREALVLCFLRKARPVDGCAPAGTNISATGPQALAFNVALLQPATHNLSVQWLTNGTPVPGATNLAFAVLPQTLGDGSSVVSAVVSDPTAFVRTDSGSQRTQTVSWNVSVSLPQLRLDSPAWLPGGKFACRVSGYAPQGFVIQGATNFSNWLPLATNFLVGGQCWFTNAAGGIPKRFFRAVTPP